MKNYFTEALNIPTGVCMQNKGKNDCPRWPDRYPSPCCWLSCSELCAAACLKLNNRYGEKCRYYGGECCVSTGIGQDTGYGQRRVAGA